MTVVVARMVGVIFIIFTTLPDDLESFGAYMALESKKAPFFHRNRTLELDPRTQPQNPTQIAGP